MGNIMISLGIILMLGGIILMLGFYVGKITEIINNYKYNQQKIIDKLKNIEDILRDIRDEIEK